MRMLQQILGTTLAIVFFAPAAWAQQSHTISSSALDQAVQQRVSQDQADRDAIRNFLHRPEVKQVATKAGLSVQKAEAAVSTLQGDDLKQVAAQARSADQQLAGGATTVVITTTTIIIILLVVILIVVIAD
jgi:hypothetical protein